MGRAQNGQNTQKEDITTFHKKTKNTKQKQFIYTQKKKQKKNAIIPHNPTDGPFHFSWLDGRRVKSLSALFF